MYLIISYFVFFFTSQNLGSCVLCVRRFIINKQWNSFIICNSSHTDVNMAQSITNEGAATHVERFVINLQSANATNEALPPVVALRRLPLTNRAGVDAAADVQIIPQCQSPQPALHDSLQPPYQPTFDLIISFSKFERDIYNSIKKTNITSLLERNNADLKILIEKCFLVFLVFLPCTVFTCVFGYRSSLFFVVLHCFRPGQVKCSYFVRVRYQFEINKLINMSSLINNNNT